VKLANRADVLAKTGAAKKTIDNYRHYKIPDDDPSGQPWTIPQAKCFVGPEVNGKQADRDPLRAQPSWPLPVPRQDPASKIAGKGEWTSKTKEVSEHEQC
jgi:hypothetical protein